MTALEGWGGAVDVDWSVSAEGEGDGKGVIEVVLGRVTDGGMQADRIFSTCVGGITNGSNVNNDSASLKPRTSLLKKSIEFSKFVTITATDTLKPTGIALIVPTSAKGDTTPGALTSLFTIPPYWFGGSEIGDFITSGEKVILLNTLSNSLFGDENPRTT